MERSYSSGNRFVRKLQMNLLQQTLLSLMATQVNKQDSGSAGADLQGQPDGKASYEQVMSDQVLQALKGQPRCIPSAASGVDEVCKAVHSPPRTATIS
jgi:hypothetical protein